MANIKDFRCPGCGVTGELFVGYKVQGYYYDDTLEVNGKEWDEVVGQPEFLETLESKLLCDGCTYEGKFDKALKAALLQQLHARGAIQEETT